MHRERMKLVFLPFATLVPDVPVGKIPQMFAGRRRCSAGRVSQSITGAPDDQRSGGMFRVRAWCSPLDTSETQIDTGRPFALWVGFRPTKLFWFDVFLAVTFGRPSSYLN